MSSVKCRRRARRDRQQRAVPAGRLAFQRLVEQGRGARGVAGGELVVDRRQRPPAGGPLLLGRRQPPRVRDQLRGGRRAAARGRGGGRRLDHRGDTRVGRLGGERQMTGPLLQAADHPGQAPMDVPPRAFGRVLVDRRRVQRMNESHGVTVERDDVRRRLPRRVPLSPRSARGPDARRPPL